MNANMDANEVEVTGFNTMPDGSCRTLKNQYQKNSLANFMQQTTRGATAVEVNIRVERGENKTDMGNTLDAKPNQGIFVEISPGVKVYATWYPKKQCYIAIRKLTPLECFRLQSFPDEYFERAQFVNSDSQLFKQAGNSVTVNVIYEIGKKLKETEEQIKAV